MRDIIITLNDSGYSVRLADKWGNTLRKADFALLSEALSEAQGIALEIEALGGFSYLWSEAHP